MTGLPKDIPLFRREAVVHRADSLFGEILLPQPKWLDYAVRLTLALLIALLAVLLFGSYTKRSQATGWVVRVPGPATVTSPAGGRIARVLVKDGAQVQEGEALVEISRIRSSSSSADVEADIAKRLVTERSNLARQIDIERNLLAQKREGIDAEIGALADGVARLEGMRDMAAAKLRLTQDDVRRKEEMVSKGWLPRASLDDAKAMLLAAQMNSQEIAQRLGEQDTQRRIKQDVRKELPLQFEQRENELRSRLTSLDGQITENDSAATVVVRAPVDGIVTGLALNLGESVLAGKRMLAVVPTESAFRAHLLVPSRDAGFLEAGMPVWIRYDAFPYQKFGQYRGIIDRVDLTVITPENQDGPVRLNEPAYRVMVTLDSQAVEAYGSAVPLQDGLTLHAAISQGRQRVVDLILEPIKAAGRSLY